MFYANRFAFLPRESYDKSEEVNTEELYKQLLASIQECKKTEGELLQHELMLNRFRDIFKRTISGPTPMR